MLTIKAEIQKDKKRSDGTYNVKIRFTLGKNVKRISTNFYVTPKDLTESFQIKENCRLKMEIDKVVYEYRRRCIKLDFERNALSLDEIIDYIKTGDGIHKPIDFIEFSRVWIKKTEIKGKKNYVSALNALIAYIGEDSIDISSLTVPFLRGFINFLDTRRMLRVQTMMSQGKRIPTNRAVSLYLGSIRHLFNEAKKEYNDYDRNIIRIATSPFDNIQMPKQEVARKRALSPELVRKIWKLPYRYDKNGNEKPCRFNLAKDCFILSFCLIGMNSVDLYNINERIGDTIIYCRTKTKDRRADRAMMQVEIPSMINPILEKYKDETGRRLLNFYQTYSLERNFNRAINMGLKEIGSIIGVFDLEFYSARHSWATIALNKVGIDKYIVHSSLNHVDDSMKVTDIYIERDFTNENRANAKVVKFVFR